MQTAVGVKNKTQSWSQYGKDPRKNAIYNILWEDHLIASLLEFIS